MKRILICSALVIGLAGAGYGVRAMAADTPDGGPPAMGPGVPPGPGAPPWPGGWGPGKHMGKHPGWPPGPGMRPDGGWHDRAFALFAPVQDKKLTVADVKIIAQAILLEHGNHDWTVADVTVADKTIHFSYATAHGDVVATFAIDPATGRVTRVS